MNMVFFRESTIPETYIIASAAGQVPLLFRWKILLLVLVLDDRHTRTNCEYEAIALHSIVHIPMGENRPSWLGAPHFPRSTMGSCARQDYHTLNGGLTHDCAPTIIHQQLQDLKTLMFRQKQRESPTVAEADPKPCYRTLDEEASR